jgi:hypothetical protein
VKLLSEKYQTSERNIYYDAETRNTWQPALTKLFDLDKARLVVMNRYDFSYRQASLRFQTASEALKPVYLSKMVEVTDRLVDLLGLETLKEKQDAEKRKIYVENELSKNEPLLQSMSLCSK